MAESRIIKYDKKKKTIQYYYEDHKTDERVEVEEHIFTFMKKRIQHIPETQFKMIRYCGLYASCTSHHKSAMEKRREKTRRPKKEFSYRREITY